MQTLVFFYKVTDYDSIMQLPWYFI